MTLLVHVTVLVILSGKLTYVGTPMTLEGDLSLPLIFDIDEKVFAYIYIYIYIYIYTHYM
jgi:hypothetical protein